jgi:hypothetical protein
MIVHIDYIPVTCSLFTKELEGKNRPLHFYMNVQDSQYASTEV